jgi:hypothetical protein
MRVSNFVNISRSLVIAGLFYLTLASNSFGDDAASLIKAGLQKLVKVILMVRWPI